MKVDKSNNKKIFLLSQLIKEAGYVKTLSYGALIISNYLLELLSIYLAIRIFKTPEYNFLDLTLEFNKTTVIIVIIILLAIRSLSRAVTRNLQEKIKFELQNKFREDMMDKIIFSDYEKLENIGRGSLNKLVIVNVSKCVTSIDQFLRFTNQTICFSSYLIVLLLNKTYDSSLVLIVFLTTIFSLIIYRPNTWSLGHLMNKYSGKINKTISNGIVAIKTIKSAGSEEWLLRKFKKNNANFKLLSLKNIYRNNFFSCLKDIIVLIAIGFWLVLIRDDLNLLSIGTSILFCYKISSSTSNAIKNWRGCISLLPAYLEINQISSKIEKINHSGININDQTISKQLINYKNNIQAIKWIFKGGSQKCKISNIYLKKGEITVISGISGAGKTTFLDTFMGLQYLDGSEWKIEYNIESKNTQGVIKNENLISKVISYSPQDPILLESSLRDNLLLGNKLEYSNDELFVNMKELGIAHLITREFGFNKEIDYSIKPISGGELQKINLLRNWLKNNPIEIYDEPTSFQDELSIENIIKRIKKRSHKKILLIVSHDYRVIQIAKNHIILKG